MGKFFTFPVKSKVVVFKNIADGEKVLFLCDSKFDKQEALRALVRASLLENKGVFYSYAFPESAVELEKQDGLRIYEMGIRRSVEKAENTLQDLSNALGKFFREYRGGTAILDFDSSPGYLLREELVSVLKSFFKSFPEATVITCFSIEAIDTEFLEQIFKLYSLVVVSADAEKTIASPVVVRGKAEIREIDVISTEVADSLVKKFLDLIILSILSEEPMHGYNIIKMIFRQCGVLVSQGMLYPLLHEMEEEGLVKQEAANRGRGKVYVITSKGREVARAKLREFSDTLHYLLSLIGGGSSMSP
jgi:DNA-binding PadR family transcriptional regulator